MHAPVSVPHTERAPAILHTFGQAALDALNVNVDSHTVPSMCINGATSPVEAAFSGDTLVVSHAHLYEALRSRLQSLNNVTLEQSKRVIGVDAAHGTVSVEDSDSVRLSAVLKHVHGAVHCSGSRAGSEFGQALRTPGYRLHVCCSLGTPLRRTTCRTR